MGRLFEISIFVIMIACQAVPKKQTVSPDAKMQQINDLAEKSKNNVITLDDSTYSYYAISKPRPYSLIVFLTAAHPKFKCSVCKSLDKEFQILAQSYADARDNYSNKPPIYFIRLDYESSQRIFQNYETNTVPVIFYIAPFQNDKGTKDFEVLVRDKLQLTGTPDAEQISNFIRDRTGISINIIRSMIWAYIVLICIFIGLGLAVKPVINSLPFWLSIIRSKTLWSMVSSGIYTCAISGLIFDIIRNPPMYYANPQTGQIQFFYGQSGSQFVVEGFVIGFLNLLCAGALIFITTIAPKFKDNQSKSSAITSGCICFLICFLWIRSLYRMKNRWYTGF
mmetsp:Transcript_12040/g.12104  ORF Transcript_12040/g.12104 Transcript_12040/m.12104 type:complete len:337 (-) Transcript_12040:35-1045(-)